MRTPLRHPARRDVVSSVDGGIATSDAAPSVASDIRIRKPSKPRRPRRRDPSPAGVILFLAANPQTRDLLRLGEEGAAIQRELQMTPHRDDFRFESRWAVSVDELIRHLTELDPTVIHFSGHGGGSACVMLQDELGQPQPVSARALAMIIQAAAHNARVIVLNACYSAVQAEALVTGVDERRESSPLGVELDATGAAGGAADYAREGIDCVIGMDGAIGDDAARAFAIRFYGAIGNGRSIGNAVEHGVAALAAKQLPDEVLPRCLTRSGVDAGEVFVGRAPGRAPVRRRRTDPRARAGP